MPSVFQFKHVTVTCRTRLRVIRDHVILYYFARTPRVVFISRGCLKQHEVQHVRWWIPVFDLRHRRLDDRRHRTRQTDVRHRLKRVPVNKQNTTSFKSPERENKNKNKNKINSRETRRRTREIRLPEPDPAPDVPDLIPERGELPLPAVVDDERGAAVERGFTLVQHR